MKSQRMNIDPPRIGDKEDSDLPRKEKQKRFVGGLGVGWDGNTRNLSGWEQGQERVLKKMTGKGVHFEVR